MRRAVRGQDRPAQAAVSIDEERRDSRQNQMVGLIPANQPAAAVGLVDRREAEKGVHLVLVAPYLRRQIVRPVHVAVGQALQQVRVVVRQAPQQPIHQPPAALVAMHGDRFGERDERLRYVAARTRRRGPALAGRRPRQAAARELGRARGLPQHLVGGTRSASSRRAAVRHSPKSCTASLTMRAVAARAPRRTVPAPARSAGCPR